MAGLIHPTAQIDPGARLASGVRVGAAAVIGAEVEIGPDCEIGPGAQVYGPTRLGRENRVFPLACVGFDPQDLKYQGERSELWIGDRNTVRELATLNRGTAFGGGVTRIGDDNLFMAYSHVGHDSQVGSRTVFTNGATLAGHVEVADDATIGAMSAVHQFCRVGRHAYIGGFSVVTLDALPFARTVGQKPLCYGVNRIGLERKGFSPEGIREIERALRVLLRSGKNTSQALEELRALPARGPDVDYLIGFVAESKRGVIKTRRPGSRGAAAD
ncbi:MAG TPA: acyl-ACP--UDP-N-acetylglucosamine O-acyltransferase [Thermoanaerobaculia bacterium]|nr:acyl-ACP--UDP-N-acetylglucosamine O-acyltransferase [Thermoanaerobaculia bacterium]